MTITDICSEYTQATHKQNQARLRQPALNASINCSLGTFPLTHAYKPIWFELCSMPYVGIDAVRNCFKMYGAFLHDAARNRHPNSADFRDGRDQACWSESEHSVAHQRDHPKPMVQKRTRSIQKHKKARKPTNKTVYSEESPPLCRRWLKT